MEKLGVRNKYSAVLVALSPERNILTLTELSQGLDLNRITELEEPELLLLKSVTIETSNGKSMIEICSDMKRHIKTVEGKLTPIYLKLGVTTKTQAMVMYLAAKEKGVEPENGFIL